MSRSGASSWIRWPASGTRSSLAPGISVGQPVRAVDRDPGVLGAPDDLHGQVERRVQRLDLVGVALVGLRDLPVERRLAGGAEPGLDQQVEVVGPQRSVRGAGDVLADERLVQRRRERGEHRRVRGDEPEEVRAPRGQRDHVDEGQRAVRRPVQEVRPQGDGAAVVVRDHVRRRQSPVRRAGRRGPGPARPARRRPRSSTRCRSRACPTGRPCAPRSARPRSAPTGPRTRASRGRTPRAAPGPRSPIGPAGHRLRTTPSAPGQDASQTATGSGSTGASSGT